MSEKKQKNSEPWVNCEECGGKVKIVDPIYPQSYTCGKCGHVFTWVNKEK